MTSKSPPQTADRKNAHLDLAKASLPLNNHTLDAVKLPYCALPECDLNVVSLKTEFLGAELAAPFMITGMTGGTERAMSINKVLAQTAQQQQVPWALALNVPALNQGKVNLSYAA